jgi:nitrogenase molybdenum-iron protein beta chain
MTNILEYAPLQSASFIDRPRHTCALGGALFTLRAIPRAIPIIHASPGCGYNVYTAMNAGAGYLGGGYCGGTGWSSSNVVENEIVFGGEERLREQILSTLELMDGDIYVVISGCMVEMIGDDIKTVVAGLPDCPVPLLALPTPSFKGNSYDGYDIITRGLLAHFTKKGKRQKDLVNILGLVPGQDIFYRGNLEELKRILGELGIRANTFFGDGEGLESFKEASKAALTLVFSEVTADSSAEFLAHDRGIPFVRLPLPIGSLATSRFISFLAKELKIPKSTVKNVISFEERRYYDYLERVSDIYNDVDLQRYAVVVADSNYAPAATNFLAEELGFIPVLTVITDPLLPEKKKRVSERFSERQGIAPLIRFGTQASEVKRFLRQAWPARGSERYFDGLSPGLVLGSVYERELADDNRLPLVTISFPATNRVIFQEARAGYNGGLSLASEIFTTLVSGR